MIIYRHLGKFFAKMLVGVLVSSASFAIDACDTHSSSNTEHYNDVKKQIEQLRDSGQRTRKNSLFDLAIKIHTEELRLAKSIGDTTDMVKALNNIGTNYRRLGMLEDASRHHMDALLLCMKDKEQESETVQKNRLMSLNGLGNVYLVMGDLKEADSIFRLALDGEKKLDSKNGQAINLANIGSVKEKMGQEDSAWIYYRYSLAMNKQAQSKLGEALCFSHFANLHEKKGRYEEALEEYKHAYDIMADSPDDWHKLEAGVNIAKLYIQLGQYQQAEQFLKEVDATATRIHSLDHRSRIYYLYYQLYEKKGNTKAALDNYVLGTQFKDSVVDAKKMNMVQNMRIGLEREQGKEQLKKLDERYQTERWALRIITITLLIIVLAAGAVIIRQRKKLRNISDAT